MLRRVAKTPAENLLPTTPQAESGDSALSTSLSGADGFVTPPGADPLLLFPFLRFLRDYIPDVSAGVWTWVRLCSTPQRVEYHGGTEEQIEEARAIVERLDANIYEFDHMKSQGMDALVNSFFLSIFTYGSFAGEVVLREDRLGIDRLYFINPATIRFRRVNGSRRLLPYQLTQDNSEIALNPASFVYYGLDTDGGNPYGRSPLLSLPFVVRIQQQLIEDMARAMHNSGWPTLHVTYTPPEREPGESPGDYYERTENDYESIRQNITGKETDSNFITYNNVQIEYLNPSGSVAQRWSLSLQAITEQVVAGLHLAPFMLGRNWGTTETWGATQYQLMTNNAVSVQRGAKRMCEWLRNLELSLHGSPVRVRHHFTPHPHLSSYEAARTRALEADTALKLEEKGIFSAEEVRNLMEKWK